MKKLESIIKSIDNNLKEVEKYINYIEHKNMVKKKIKANKKERK